MRSSVFLSSLALFALAQGGFATAQEIRNISDDATTLVIEQVSFGGEEKGACECECVDECSCYLFGPSERYSIYSGNNGLGITAGGWTQIGYHDNQTPLSAVKNDAFAFNDHADRINLHQQWLWAEKALSGDECSWDWGFRIDFMYGTDAAKTQAFGGDGWDNDPRWDRNGGYGWAIPQLYVEVGKGDLSVKVGHFYTLVGYEVVTAPDNFFYSHALTMFNSEPFTHTGALVTYGVSDDLEVYGGWTAGWDTGFEQEMSGSNFLGGASFTVSEDLSVTYILTAGNFGRIGDQGYSHSIVADWNITENLNYVFQSDYKRVDEPPIGSPVRGGDDDVGINQYLFYSFSDCFAVGGRMEWWKDDGHSHYAATFGLNYRPHANFVLRPEIRQDWQPFADFDQATFGMDAILVY